VKSGEKMNFSLGAKKCQMVAKWQLYEQGVQKLKKFFFLQVS
jgi:hypothetical protein